MGKKSGKWTVGSKKDKTERATGISNRSRQKSKRSDRKVESNDRPAILDRRKTPDATGLPSG